MRKLLIALMIMATAVTAFAEVSLSGSYHARGSYYSNVSSMDTDTDDVNMVYDHDFDLWINAQTDKDTFFKSKLEIVDGNWTAENVGGGNVENADQDIHLQRVWLGHNFGVAKLEVGLMSGGGWGYSFGDAVGARYRVKTTIPAGPGNVYAILEKDAEANGLGVTTKDAEKDDSDTYILAYKGKFSGLTVAPLIAYVSNGAVQADADIDTTVTVVDIAVGGAFGAIGFETEFIYKTFSTESSNDPSNWSAYANIFGKFAGAKVGFITAYDDPDEDNGRNGNGSLGGDFDDRWIATLGDWGAYSAATVGVWANGVYADYSVNDKLDLTASFFYIMSNIDNNDSTAMDFEAAASYAITEALSYTVNFGYGSVDADGGTDPDPAYILQNTLKISF